MSDSFTKTVEMVKDDFAKKPRKFDASVDMSINLSAALPRGCVLLPNGAGKKVRVAVIAQSVPDFVEVDKVGYEDMIDEIKAGKILYDRYFIESSNIKEIAGLARILGPKGLMPSVKNGSIITSDADWKKVEDFKLSRMIDIRADKNKVINIGIGRVSYSIEKLVENLQSVLEYIKSNVENSKDVFKKVYLTSTMGNSFLLKL